MKFLQTIMFPYRSRIMSGFQISGTMKYHGEIQYIGGSIDVSFAVLCDLGEEGKLWILVSKFQYLKTMGI